MSESRNQNDNLLDWLQDLRREAGIRKGLILHGNARDIFYDSRDRQYVTLAELVVRILSRDSSLGFTLVGVWDLVDGLRFPNDKSAGRFREIVQGTARKLDPPDQGQAYDVGETDNRQESSSPSRPLYPDLNELLPAIRTALNREGERPLFVLEWTHMLVTQPAHPAPEERQWMLNLGKALLGGPVVSIDSDHLRNNGGLVVLLTANLGNLPPLLYQGDPRVRLLAVPQPSRPERRAFFIRHADDLRCERPNSTPGAGRAVDQTSELADTLADLTDQQTVSDLQQIMALAQRTDQPLRAERLVNLYRLGDQRSPWEELSEDKLRTAEATLRQRVVGQDEAVAHVATMNISAYLGLAGLEHSARQSKPKGVLFFVGATGVGKTELAKALAEFLFGDESACIRFDMSEFNHEHSDQRLVGAPPGYVGFEEGGQLTNAVRQRPFSVVLLDEIEKAHPRVLDKFLQILEDGRLTDGRGETTYFSESVVAFTSNIGAADMPKGESPESLRAHFIHAVEEHFNRELGRPELLNRLGENIVVFQPIVDDGFRRAILERKLAPLSDHLSERFGMDLRLSDEMVTHLIHSARDEHGGRGLLNVMQRDLVNPMARFIFDHMHQLRRGRVIHALLGDNRASFEIQEA